MSLEDKFERHKILWLLAIWSAFGVFFGVQNYVRDMYFGQRASLPGYITGWLICGYSWGILTTPAVRFIRRFSLERLEWARSLLVQIPAAVIFALAQLALYLTIAGVLFQGASRGAWEYYKFLLANELQSSILTYFAIVAAVSVYDRFFRTSEAKKESVFASETDSDNKITAVSSRSNGHAASGGNSFMRRLAVKENGRILLLDVEDIDLISSEGNYVKIHSAKNKYLIRETMSALEKKLDPAEFVRLRRSAIVRIDKIQEFRPTFNGEFEVVLRNGPTLTSSRRYRKNLESVLKV